MSNNLDLYYQPAPNTNPINNDLNTKRYLCFAEILKELHKDINNGEYTFESKETGKGEKKKTVITGLSKETKEELCANEKNSESQINDIYTDFLKAVKNKDTDEIDKYLSYIDDRYIPDKKEFIEELTKAISRLKNDEPIRGKFFLILFKKFYGLEIKQEITKEKGNQDSKINEFGEIIRPKDPNKDFIPDPNIPTFKPPENNESQNTEWGIDEYGIVTLGENFKKQPNNKEDKKESDNKEKKKEPNKEIIIEPKEGPEEPEL